jgi:hypothetical protein
MIEKKTAKLFARDHRRERSGTVGTPNFQSVPVLSAINLQFGKLSAMILDERSVAIVNRAVTPQLPVGPLSSVSSWAYRRPSP